MWIEKLYEGVLRVLTPLGPRYVKPSFLERIYLFWIFRNFPTLPVNVLSTTQKKRIERICAGHGFLSHIGTYPEADFPVLGTLEQRPALAETAQGQRSAASVGDSVGPFAADRHRP